MKQRQQQQCKNCKTQFAEDAPQKNYALFANYGFANEEQFKSHNSGNKHCPCKINVNEHAIEPDSSDCNSQFAAASSSSSSSGGSMLGVFATTIAVAAVSLSNAPIPDVEWGPYVRGISINEEDYIDNQEIIQLKLRKHCRGGSPLWFRSSEIAAYTILEELLNPDTQIITLVAEPGSGKTAVIHNLIHQMSMLPYDTAIHPNSITLTTGMSDTDWYNQIKHNFELRDGGYLWESIYKVEENSCIVHRSSLHRRISWLLNNLQYLSNHRFIIDEHHIADELDMTLDAEFKRLGLTADKMKEYNIKIINVSATPDVQLSLLKNLGNHKLVQLENGDQYKGFKYYSSQNMIKDYTNDVELDSLIRQKYSTPRFHFIRARTQQEKGTYRESVVDICKKNNWDIIEDDSSNNYYLSFKHDDRERQAEGLHKSIIRTYLQPLRHTCILIKNKYPASKRLKVTSFTGLVAEKPAAKMNTTVTCNGLIPRFWGYDDVPEFPHNQKPIFICNKDSVDEYIKFSTDFVYNGKSYTSNRIKSDENKLIEFKNTWCGNLASIEPSRHDTRISITNGKNGERDYFDSVTDIAEFLRDKGLPVAANGVNEFNRGPRGYVIPRRHPEINTEEKRLTRAVYEEKFVKNGGGSHINKQYRPPSQSGGSAQSGSGGSGQPYMIWPVYETMESAPEDVMYYVHYLKL
jgi:hypothetical protein